MLFNLRTFYDCLFSGSCLPSLKSSALLIKVFILCNNIVKKQAEYLNRAPVHTISQGVSFKRVAIQNRTTFNNI